MKTLLIIFTLSLLIFIVTVSSILSARAKNKVVWEIRDAPGHYEIGFRADGVVVWKLNGAK